MPELPEVEVTRRGIAPFLEGRDITGVVQRRSGLRWPFPAGLDLLLQGQRVLSTGRRGKYLLIHFSHGTLIIHLGMSGHLRMLPKGHPPQKHDHFDLLLGAQIMRFTDPRRFGAVLWHPQADGDIESHILLRRLGVEPLTSENLAALLHQADAHSQRGDQTSAVGGRYRRRRGQYLRVRKSFRGRYPSEHSSATHFTRALRKAGGRYSPCAGCGY
jgi:DNA-formamidopyrimidine glycosylase